MAYETIIVEIEDHVALIKLNRPDALNALNDQLMSELATALGESQQNDKVRCIVLTGSEKAFAAGADIKMMSEKSFVDVFTEDLFTPDSEAITRIRKPIIAAVSGYALGGGCERSGLVSRVVPAKKLMEEAMSAAQKIAEKSMITVMAAKEAVNRSYETTLREGLLFERRVFHSLFATEDQKEGMAAFTEKRQAQFRDK